MKLFQIYGMILQVNLVVSIKQENISISSLTVTKRFSSRKTNQHFQPELQQQLALSSP